MEEGGAFAAVSGELLSLAAQLDALSGGSSAGAGPRIAAFEAAVRVRPASAGASVRRGGIGARDPPARVWVEKSRDVVVAGTNGDPERRFRAALAFSRHADDVMVGMALGDERVGRQWLWPGFDVTVLALGATATGKTRTLSAVLDSCIISVFDEARSAGEDVSLGISCWELTHEDKELDLLAVGGEGSGFSAVSCGCIAEARVVLEFARRRSNNWEDDGQTPKPSESHSFIRLVLARYGEDQISVAHFIDLVGVGRDLPDEYLAKQKRNRINRQLLGVERLLSELSHLEVNQLATSSLKSMRDSLLTQRISPLITNNCKAYILATLLDSPTEYKRNVATMRSVSSASLVNTACLKAKTRKLDLKILSMRILRQALQNDLNEKDLAEVQQQMISERSGKEELEDEQQAATKKSDPSGEEFNMASDFEGEIARLEEENEHLGAWCEETAKMSLRGKLLKEYMDDVEESKEMLRRTHKISQLLENNTTTDSIDQARDFLKAENAEVERLENLCIILRKRQPQFGAREKFLENLKETMKTQQRRMRATDMELERRRSGIAEIERRVLDAEERRKVLQGLNLRLEADREATSHEVMQMRKFLSHTESEREKKEILQRVDNRRNNGTYPFGSGIFSSVELLLARLENMTSRFSPGEMTTCATLRETIESLGLQLQQAECREKQLLDSMSEQCKKL